MLVVRLALAQVLEDSQHRRDLTRSNDLLPTAAEERAQEAHERGDVAPTLPQRRREEGRENGAVHVGQAGRNGVQLEELGEDLKDEGSELGNVLREDGLEGREEGALESRERGGVAGGDEAARKLMRQLRSWGLTPKLATHRTRAEMLSNVKWLNLGFDGFLLISTRIATRCCKIVV